GNIRLHRGEAGRVVIANQSEAIQRGARFWVASSPHWGSSQRRRRPLRPALLALLADRDHRLVGALAVRVPELLEVWPVEICRLLTGLAQRGLEGFGLHGLADSIAQRANDRGRRALRR